MNQLQSNILTGFSNLNVNWGTALNNVLDNEILYGNVLTNQALTTGSNTINHGLGRVLIGWWLVRIRALATVYDTQDSNPTPASTLLLTTSADVTVDIYVF